MVSMPKNVHAIRFIRSGFAVIAFSLLGACANMTAIPAGSPLAQVEAKYGAPNYSCTAPNGSRRLIWTGQPLGQFAWGTHVDNAGNIDRVVSLLTDEHFRLLATGTWTQENVRCEFGPPAEISTVGLPSSTQLVWSYRYRQNGVWNSLMYVYFGGDRSQVTRFHPGPDPMYEERDNRDF